MSLLTQLRRLHRISRRQARLHWQDLSQEISGASCHAAFVPRLRLEICRACRTQRTSTLIHVNASAPHRTHGKRFTTRPRCDHESDAKTDRTPKHIRAKFTGSALFFCEAFGVRTRPRVAFSGPTRISCQRQWIRSSRSRIRIANASSRSLPNVTMPPSCPAITKSFLRCTSPVSNS